MKTILITGAGTGFGRLVAFDLARKGHNVIATVEIWPQVTALQEEARTQGLTLQVEKLDVTNAAQTQAAVERVESLDILINNAGLALYDDLSERAALEQHLAVNLFGTYGVTQAFLPLLSSSRGAIVNTLSVAAFAPLPLIPAYSISKAAAFSLSLSLRALLSGRVTVHAVMTGPVDTDMTRGLDIPKASPESVARAIFDGVENGDEEIFPDPMSQSLAESWRSGAVKALERENAALLDAVPVEA